MNKWVYWLPITLVVIFSGCHKPTEEAKLKDNKLFNTTIAGQITGFNKKVHDHTITLNEMNIRTDDSDISLALIDTTNARFSFNIELTQLKMLTLRYQAMNYEIFASPGDSLVVEFKTDRSEEINFKVTNSAEPVVNKYLNDYIARYDSIEVNLTKPDPTNLSFENWSARASHKRDQLNLMRRKFLNENDIASESFEKLTSEINDLTYYSELFSFVLYHKMINQDKPSTDNLTEKAVFVSDYPVEELEQLTQNISLDDTTLLSNRYFYHFYNVYSLFNHIKTMDLAKRQKIDTRSPEFDELFLSNVDKTTDALEGELLSTRFIYLKITNLQRYPEDSTRLKQLIRKTPLNNTNSNWLMNELERKKSALINTPKGETIPVLNEDSEIIKYLTEKFEGSALYLKFWSPWCGPCMASMPSAERLNKEYAQANFKIIAVCIDSEKEKWENIVKNSSVTHVFLDSDQSNLIRKAYSISTIPRNVILDSNGDMFMFNAPETGYKDKINANLIQILEEATFNN